MFENQLRITLIQTMKALQVSRRELKRMEIRGILVPIPRTDPRGRIYYRPTDAMRLVEKISPSSESGPGRKDRKKAG